LTTAIIQRHHITYDPEWIVELTMKMHQVISYLQRTKATPEQYALMINFQHAITYECNRMRMELDTDSDMRVRKPNE
jgi:hypothetical protein